MEIVTRRHAAVFAAPLIVGLATARQAATNVRLVDFLLLFASVALFEIGLTGLIRVLRGRPLPGTSSSLNPPSP